MKFNITIKISERVFAVFALILFGALTTPAQTPTLRNNGRIAFTSDRDGNREIYVMNADGTGQTRITNNTLLDDHPTWSPDGTKIAIVSIGTSFGCGISIMNADGSNKVEVTSLSTTCIDPTSSEFYFAMSWSPDGRQIAFEDANDIFVVNVDGSGRQNLTANNTEWDISPAWSPDGSKILFASLRGGPNLYTMNPDGSGQAVLPGSAASAAIQPSWSPDGSKMSFVVDHTDDCFMVRPIYIASADLTTVQTFHGGGCIPEIYQRPRWSPDGQRMLFHVRSMQAQAAEIFTKNIDGSGIRQLTDTPGSNFNASWQSLPRVRRNGKIAFTSDRDGNREIYVMNSDGSNEVRLTTNNIVDDHPTWSPDGKRIAFLSQRPTGVFAIFTMSADGTGKTELTPVNYLPLWTWNGWDAWAMSWSPDGRQIVFSNGSVHVSTLVIVNSDGTDRRDLTSGYAPTWSPDGSKVLFLREGPGPQLNQQILTIRTDGSDLRNITPTLTAFYTVNGITPVWSPDGQKIAFGSFDGANMVINIANPDGSAPWEFAIECTNLVPQGCSSVSHPAWSPDGRTIAFINWGLQSGTEIYLKDIDEGTSTRITNSPGINSYPNWQPLASAVFDFDGDGRSDTSVFRPSDSVWYLNRSTQGFSATQFGLSTDKITPSDFDGDGKTDIAVFHDGVWYWLDSSDSGFNSIQFGLAGDIPQPADFGGDGRSELAVYRGGTWWTLNLTNGQAVVKQFGLATDKPVAADYDGDGRADHAVYRNGTWYLDQSALGFAAIPFGLPADRLVPADYDGDGRTDPAVYRNGIWYQLRSQMGFAAIQFGLAADVPAPADYDGDGKTDPAVYRGGLWYLLQSTSGVSIQNFGLANDKPVPAAFLQLEEK